jgi:hypothetical protein
MERGFERISKDPFKSEKSASSAFHPPTPSREINFYTLLHKKSTMRTYLLPILFLAAHSVFGQKMLLLERANRAQTTKMYIGQTLKFRLAGEENYWYERTIMDMLPESNTLMLDNFAVKISDIQTIKVRRKRIWGIAGGAAFSLGATLALATTIGRYGYQDKGVDAPKLYAISAVSFGAGWYLNTPRKLKLGKKHRLRIVEIKFPPAGG